MSSPLEKVAAMREQARSRAEENRRRMPTVAAVVDAFKAAFGADQVTVAYASENGITLGQPGPAGVLLSETIVGPMNKPKKGKNG